MEGSFLFMQYFEMLRSGNSAKINEAEKLKEKFDKLYRFDQFLFHSSITFDNSHIFYLIAQGWHSQGKSDKVVFFTLVRESQGMSVKVKEFEKKLGKYLENRGKFCC